eukprot:6945115-Prymnesium_polylepis.1
MHGRAGDVRGVRHWARDELPLLYGERLQEGRPRFHHVRQCVGANRDDVLLLASLHPTAQHRDRAHRSSRFRRRTAPDKGPKLVLMRHRPDAAVQVNTTPRRHRSCANGARLVRLGYGPGLLLLRRTSCCNAPTSAGGCCGGRWHPPQQCGRGDGGGVKQRVSACAPQRGPQYIERPWLVVRSGVCENRV